MKNMKVSLKLMVSFLIVIGFAVLVGGLGIFGMYRINEADDAMYEGNYLPTVLADEISQNIVEQRVYIRNFVIYDVDEDAAAFQETVVNIEASKQEMTELFAEYKDTIANPDDEAAFDEFLHVYNDEWLSLIDTIQAYGTANQTQEAKEALHAGAVAAERMDELSDNLQEINLADGRIAVDTNTDLFNLMTWLEIAALLLAIAVALFFAFYISSLISKPLAVLTAFMKKAGTAGDISLSPEDIENIGKFAQAKDEIGQCIGSTAGFVGHLAEIAGELEKIAGGDLTAEINCLSDKDVMGVALKTMLDSFNAMFTEIRTASDQVSSGAGQVSQGAQQLASGSSEQAASIEEFSATLTELQEKTTRNAGNSTKARDVNSETGKRLDDSIRSMNEMLEAMKAIDESSSSITKVIKVIDDIAFQTNILALNAAVEAARAGQHGKGFAVVADEVRNLASKSAAAAKETATLIEGSSERVREGNQIVAKTNADLAAAAENSRESTQLIEEVTAASTDQARSIREINQGIEQISSVVQANSATAEESAAASEEMSAQAVVLNEIVARFKLRDEGYQSMGAVSANAKKAQPDVSGFALAQGKY